MKTSAMLLSAPVVALLSSALLSACDAPPNCRYGETPVRVRSGAYADSWICVPRSGTSDTPSPSRADDAGAAVVVAPPAGAPPADSPDDGKGAPVGSGSCGAVAAESDPIHVVEKHESAPVFAPGSAGPTSGKYALVQASFFRSEEGPIGVGKLRATLEVRGSTLTIGAVNATENVEANESITFLLGSSGMTKVCETRHGNVSTWIFPVATGASAQSELVFAPDLGLVRLVVARPEGATELVFAR